MVNRGNNGYQEKEGVTTGNWGNQGEQGVTRIRRGNGYHGVTKGNKW